ncbi:MAG: hypothetical protein MJ198_03575 [Bacteroidales bacterium]|nr:hypothetical protein [Bacteroidales bacterium]
MKRFLPYCLALFICFSCQKEQIKKDFSWSDYYPIAIGNERIYEYTNIRIDLPAGIKDTDIFFIKEKTISLLSHTNECEVFAINKFKSSSESGPWEDFSSMSIQQYAHSIVTVEENIPYQILRFPAKYDYSWDLNLYNTDLEKSIYYKKINMQDTIFNVVYDSVLIVLQDDFKSLYTYQFAEDHFAKNFGLIYRQRIDVESQPNHAKIDLSLPIEKRITKGTISTCRLVNAEIQQ